MMKKNLLWFCSMMLFATVMTVNLTSCDPEDPCDGVVCSNGECFEGDCICNVGFIIDPVTGDCVPADPCDGVVCGDNANCFDGNCECDTGFEMDGNDCVRSINKFLGTYNTTEEDCMIFDAYPIVIEQVVGQPNGIFIRNLGDFECIDPDGAQINYDVFATVDGNFLSIASDETCSIVFNGSGSIDGNTITIPYSATLSATGEVFDCTAVLVRQ